MIKATISALGINGKSTIRVFTGKDWKEDQKFVKKEDAAARFAILFPDLTKEIIRNYKLSKEEIPEELKLTLDPIQWEEFREALIIYNG
jgi:hypothetical protein